MSIRGVRRVGEQPVLKGSPGEDGWSLDRRDLDVICFVLNEKDDQDQPTPLARALIELLERLESCGGNLHKMMNGQGLLRHNVETACFGQWVPSKNRGAYLELQPSPKADFRVTGGIRPELFAAELFHVGTLNPEWDKLAGPCKWKHCGKYFLLKGNRRTAYCSRRCCQLSAASRCRQKCLQREHADKLQRAEEAARRWRTARTKDDWKAFVSKQEPDITPKFLTRAVNKGELKTPTKGQKP